MRDDRTIYHMAIERPAHRPRMPWRPIVAALALEAFALTMIGAVVWFLFFGVVTK